MADAVASARKFRSRSRRLGAGWIQRGDRAQADGSPERLGASNARPSLRPHPGRHGVGPGSAAQSPGHRRAPDLPAQCREPAAAPQRSRTAATSAAPPPARPASPSTAADCRPDRAGRRVADAAAAAPDPLAALDPADRPIAEKMRDLLAAKIDRIFASKKERAAVEAFYQNRNLAPLWLDKGVENARAKAVDRAPQGADADGLEASDYRIPNFAGSSGRMRWPRPS